MDDNQAAARMPGAVKRTDALRESARRAMARDDQGTRQLSRSEDAADWVRFQVRKRRPVPPKVAAGPEARREAAERGTSDATASTGPLARPLVRSGPGAAGPTAATGGPTWARTATVLPTTPTTPTVRPNAPVSRPRTASPSASPLRRWSRWVLLALAAAAVLLGWVAGVSWSTLLLVFLVALGAVVVLDGLSGATSRPLIALGLVLSIVALGTWRADVDLGGGLGARTVTPTAGVQTYSLSTGQLTVDLRDLPAGGIGTVRVRAEVGVGRLVIRLPRDSGARIDTVAGVGQSYVVANRSVGVGVEDVSYPGAERARIVLDLHVGVGSIEVQE